MFVLIYVQKGGMKGKMKRVSSVYMVNAHSQPKASLVSYLL